MSTLSPEDALRYWQELQFRINDQLNKEIKPRESEPLPVARVVDFASRELSDKLEAFVSGLPAERGRPWFWMGHFYEYLHGALDCVRESVKLYRKFGTWKINTVTCTICNGNWFTNTGKCKSCDWEKLDQLVEINPETWHLYFTGPFKTNTQFVNRWFLAEPHTSSSDVAFYEGNGLLRVNGMLIKIEDVEDTVVRAIVHLRAASQTEFDNASGVDRSARRLKEIVEKYPQLRPFFKFPGKRGAGGYSTSVISLVPLDE